MENAAALVSARAWATIVTLAFAALSACSKGEQPNGVATPAPAPGPAEEIAAYSAAGDMVHAKVTAAGIPSTYVARFENGQLTQISERRGTGQAGEYRFYGARVTRYAGAPLGAGPDVDIEFDLQGAVLSATRVGGAGPDIPAEEISAVSTRGQLLRSHALTQRSVKSHQPH